MITIEQDVGFALKKFNSIKFKRIGCERIELQQIRNGRPLEIVIGQTVLDS